MHGENREIQQKQIEMKESQKHYNVRFYPEPNSKIYGVILKHLDMKKNHPDDIFYPLTHST